MRYVNQCAIDEQHMRNEQTQKNIREKTAIHMDAIPFPYDLCC